MKKKLTPVIEAALLDNQSLENSIEHRLEDESDHQYVSRVFGAEFQKTYQFKRFLHNMSHEKAIEETKAYMDAQQC